MTTMSNTETHFMKLPEWIPRDKVTWEELSSNPNAIHLLEQNLDKMTTEGWSNLSLKPIYERNLYIVLSNCS